MEGRQWRFLYRRSQPPSLHFPSLPTFPRDQTLSPSPEPNPSPSPSRASPKPPPPSSFPPPHSRNRKPKTSRTTSSRGSQVDSPRRQSLAPAAVRAPSLASFFRKEPANSSSITVTLRSFFLCLFQILGFVDFIIIIPKI